MVARTTNSTARMPQRLCNDSFPKSCRLLSPRIVARIVAGTGLDVSRGAERPWLLPHQLIEILFDRVEQRLQPFGPERRLLRSGSANRLGDVGLNGLRTDDGLLGHDGLRRENGGLRPLRE